MAAHPARLRPFFWRKTLFEPAESTGFAAGGQGGSNE
jgi:hypothetical protein